MLRPKRALMPTPMEGGAKWHGGDVASRAGRTCSALEESRWQRLLRRVARPLAAFAALIATEVETVAQQAFVGTGVEAVNAIKPPEANPVGGGVLDEFVSLDPAAGFGNIAKDSFFAESVFRARSNTVRSPGQFGAWTVDLGDVGLHINDFAVKDAFGNAVDLNGTRSGSMYQTINVKAGVQYRIRFQLSGNWTTFPGRPRSLSVFFGNEKATFTMNKPVGWSRTNMHWEEKTIDFVAQQDVIGLRFSSGTEGIPDGPVISQVELLSPLSPPGALDSIPVPLPPNLMEFVQDKDKAIALGKALFWDMQVGSDGRTACASCHWHAGADIRTVNTVNPGNSGSLFRGVNKTLKSSDFPFHKLKDPTVPGDSSSNPVIEDNREVTGSQGVVTENFLGVNSGSSGDRGQNVWNRIFSTQGANVRQATGRNAPTSVNAIFFDRSFWDGRANRYFNGVNPFGELDPNARVLKANAAGELESVQIQLDNGALASQAVGPPNSDVEMAWNGRTFAELGRKMLNLQPLSQQKVAMDDSVLGVYRDSSGRGLDLNQAAYAKLIREAFLPEWWSGMAKTSDGYTQMEANFSLFWGLAIMMYESTLVSDQSPYDKFARGDKDALTAKAKEGLRIFVKEGKCLNCHHGPEFAGGTISNVRGVLSQDGGVSLMPMAQGLAFYDEGFYNIGVRPTTEDLGVGGAHPLFGPLSYSRQEQSGRNPDPGDVVTSDRRVAVEGAFKAPTLRNVELTGPYMHNGSMKSLTEVVEFYTRGSDFHDSNLKDLDTDVSGISALQGNPAAIASVVEFLEHLTDPRVKYRKAPFDHPELVLPNGHLAVSAGVALDNLLLLPATGKDGGSALGSFEDALTSGLGLEVLPMPEPPKPVETAAAADAPTTSATSSTAADPATADTPATTTGSSSLVKTPFDAEMLARKAAEKQALLGTRTSEVTATTAEPAVPETAMVVDSEVDAPAAPADVEVAEAVANEGGVSLVKTPPTQELLDAKAAEKDELLGNRTSPEEKAELLSDRNSSITDPIAIGADAPDAGETDPAEEADTEEPVTSVDPAEEADTEEPVTSVDPAEEADTEEPVTPVDPAEEADTEEPVTPVDPAEEADTEEPVTLVDPAEEADTEESVTSVDPAEEADTEEPVTSVDPAEEADTEEPVTPVDPAEEADTEEPVTSVDPAEEADTEEPATSVDPAEEADTEEPMTSADPAEEADTEEPMTSADPAEEADTEEPVTSVDPAEEADTEEPVTSVDPAEEADTEEPMTSVDPAEEADTEEPVTSVDPAEEADTEEPVTSVDPAEEADTEEPVTSVDPVEEADTEEPVTSVDPAEEADTDEPVTPVDPSEEPEAGEVGTSLVKTPPTQELLDAKAAEKDVLLGNRTSSIINPIAPNAVAGEAVGKAAILGARTSRIVDPIALGATKAPAAADVAEDVVTGAAVAIVEAPAVIKPIVAKPAIVEAAIVEAAIVEAVAVEAVAVEAVAVEPAIVSAQTPVTPATPAEKAPRKGLLHGSRPSTTTAKSGAIKGSGAAESAAVTAGRKVAVVEPVVVGEATTAVSGKVAKVMVPAKSAKPMTTTAKPGLLPAKPSAAATKTTVPVSGSLAKPTRVK